MGYYEAWRLWFIADELRARDLQDMQVALDATSSNQEYRENFSNWIQSRQPRKYPSKGAIPKEVLDKFAEAFNNG